MLYDEFQPWDFKNTKVHPSAIFYGSEFPCKIFFSTHEYHLLCEIRAPTTTRLVLLCIIVPNSLQHRCTTVKKVFKIGRAVMLAGILILLASRYKIQLKIQENPQCTSARVNLLMQHVRCTTNRWRMHTRSLSSIYPRTSSANRTLQRQITTLSGILQKNIVPSPEPA